MNFCTNQHAPNFDAYIGILTCEGLFYILFDIIDHFSKLLQVLTEYLGVNSVIETHHKNSVEKNKTI